MLPKGINHYGKQRSRRRFQNLVFWFILLSRVGHELGSSLAVFINDEISEVNTVNRICFIIIARGKRGVPRHRDYVQGTNSYI